METLTVGDIVLNHANQKIEIRAIIDNVIFTRVINDDGSKSMTTFEDIEDFRTYGYTKL